ncbi:MAG: outer membrane protein assembly factor BamD [Candidatus Binatus sp.]|uniref:outer membrane protein assembly factor BamD n=1 Tax=Candidatus Binatus sp. TaxID=2811406 RepID=UPI00271C6C5B|nr:outer membrane protein assembly factor BamD [Candidatus Binatus sp.]MDO8434498.1 outer membrane protein assembly factor BamD [Candidatus Binatus sp.]
MKRALLILVAFSLLLVAACSLRKKPTGEDYYAQGQMMFAEKEYKSAIENYQKLIDEYPFSPYAEDAEMRIGLAHYEEKEYAEAIGSLDDFQRMHPTSKNLELVTYYIGMSYYDQMGREDQDQTKTQQALKRFHELEQRFPEGSFAELAHEHIVVCREMLARNYLVVGNYYYKRANFRAAESRFAELMQKYPDSPVAPDALYELGISLKKEGKKYSAAQAFAALDKHFPDSNYAKKGRAELAKLHQPVDTEEDPLPLVLAETGYPGDGTVTPDKVVVRQRDEGGRMRDGAASSSSYGADGLPNLGSAAAPAPKAAKSGAATDIASAAQAQVGAMTAAPAPATSVAANAQAQAAAMFGAAAPAASGAPVMASAAAPEASAPSLHEMQPADAPKRADPPLSVSQSPATGPATLKTIRLSANDPPLTVVLDLTGPVQFEKHLDSSSSGSTATVVLKDVTPDASLQTHLVFDKSIFKDCDVSSSSSATTITLNMSPVEHFAVIPLEQPSRLLMTFTPLAAGEKTSSAR